LLPLQELPLVVLQRQQKIDFSQKRIFTPIGAKKGKNSKQIPKLIVPLVV
jgi:hypothetical protein